MKSYFIISLMLLTGLLAARQYTLDDFIKAAINNSYSIRQKEILRQNADLNVGIAGWNLLPSADISSARTNQDGNYRNKASLEIARSISLNEPSVFDLYQAKLDKDIAELDWQQTRKETIYSIYSAWIDIAQIQKEVAIRTENLKVLRKIKEQAELQKSLGQRTTYDVKQADINV
ncbi:MAG: TolC family protein, partial [Candidatus Cloacimonetes bacterium]|nr:TolC family protein [Candidatus Cloacimonadota bacterium]